MLKKTWIWIVLGIVVLAGIGYFTYTKGVKQGMVSILGNINQSEALRAEDCYGQCTTNLGSYGGHSFCANGLTICRVN